MSRPKRAWRCTAISTLKTSPEYLTWVVASMLAGCNLRKCLRCIDSILHLLKLFSPLTTMTLTRTVISLSTMNWQMRFFPVTRITVLSASLGRFMRQKSFVDISTQEPSVSSQTHNKPSPNYYFVYAVQRKESRR